MKKSMKIILASIIAVVAVAAAVVVIVIVGAKPQKANFTLEVDGGSVAETNITAEVGKEYVLPTPTKTDYVFEGWYDNPAFTGSPVTTVSVTDVQDKTFYARWTALYHVTLNADGGSISTTDVTVKAGANVYNAVAEYVPEKSGAQFGAWYLGDTELAKNYVASENITLKARYKTAYRLEVYEQTKTLDGYELSDTDSETLYAYAGETVRAEKEMDGFRAVANENNVLSITVGEGDNTLRVYFDRLTFNVNYYANYPNGSTDVLSVTALYGEELTVPSSCFTLEGYYLQGWAASADGAVIYKTDYIESLLFNKDESDATVADSFIPTRNTSLYAKWKRGHVNMLGGDDYIYLPDENGNVVYLSRGDVFFKGDYYKKDKTFSFLADGEEILHGRILTDDTFIYGGTVAGDRATFYSPETGLNKNVTITFGEYDDLTYTVKGADNSLDESEGNYYMDDNGVYEVTFTSGSKNGEKLYFRRGSVYDEDVLTQVFRPRNEEEYALGSLVSFGVQASVVYENGASSVSFDGFGNAAYTANGSTTNYYYDYDKNTGVFTLTASGGSVFLSAKLYQNGSTKGYFGYNSELDHVYEDGGKKLTLDGTVFMTYEDGGVKTEGFYTANASMFGGHIVTVVNGNETRKFLVKSDDSSSTGEVGTGDALEENATTYSFTEKGAAYNEYIYRGENSFYYYPFIVTGDTNDDTVLVYGIVLGAVPIEFVLVAEGTSVYDSSTSRYTYKKKKKYDAAINTLVVDLATVKSFTYAYGNPVQIGASDFVGVNYWFSYVTDDDRTFDLTKTYTADDGGRLYLVAGMAYLNGTLLGAYTLNGNVLTVSGPSSLVFELTGETTYATMKEAPSASYLRNDDGEAIRNVTLVFDGKGGAVYTDENGTEYEGVVTLTDDDTYFGSQVYTFTATGASFRFLRLVNGAGVSVFAVENDKYSGTFNSESEGILVLDGFNFTGEWTDGNGVTYRGVTTINDDGAIGITYDGGRRFFDVLDNSFTVRGEEYGTYILIDNGSDKAAVTLDGYKNAEVYRSNGNERITVDAEASYSFTDDGRITLSYADGSVTYTLTLERGVYAVSSTVNANALYVVHSEAATTYVNAKNWSTLVLDDKGGAVRYTASGEKTVGRYVFVTDEILYFAAADGSDACIYDYDDQTHSATPKNFYERGFYTEDLHSLLFTRFGIAIFSEGDRSVRYYYNMKGNDVVIYRSEPNSDDANEYGFVEENLGRFADKMTYGGVEYLSNSVLEIRFARNGEKTEYPFEISRGKAIVDLLTFVPDGNAEFRVNGQITLKNADPQSDRPFSVIYDCTVVREYVDGEYVVYATFARTATANYRVYVALDYKGCDDDGESLSTYEVTGLKLVSSYTSYTYLTNLYNEYAFRGAAGANAYTNDVGTIELYNDYDAEGTQGETYIVDKTSVTLDRQIYSTATKGSDGLSYRLHFIVARHNRFNAYGFVIYAFTRTEVIESDDGYALTLETTVSSEYNRNMVGSPMTLALAKDGQNIVGNNAFRLNGVTYFVSRTTNGDGRFETTVYYRLDLETKTGGIGTEEVPLYDSLAVTPITVVTRYNSDGRTYADFNDGERTVYYIYRNGVSYFVTDCEYDEETSSYYVTCGDGSKFIVKVDGDTITVSVN